MKSLPLVSVVVPVYNVQDYIELSIQSICEQTYKNIEIILVDDQSKDESINKAKIVLLNYSVPYKIITEINKGLPGARNTGAFYSRGEYISFVDSDDCIANNHIEELMKLTLQYDLEASFSSFEEVDIHHRLGKNNKNGGYQIFTQNQLMYSFMKRKPPIHCCSLIIKRTILESFKTLFNERLKYGEDVEFMWRLFSKVSKIGCTNINSYKYLIRQNSIMTTMSENSIQKGYILLEELSNTMRLLSYQYPEKNDIYNFVLYRTMIGWIHVVCKNTNYKNVKCIIDHINKDELIKNITLFSDWKVIILSYLLKMNSFIFYLIAKNI